MMSKKTIIILAVVAAIVILGVAGVFVHHHLTGQAMPGMQMK